MDKSIDFSGIEVMTYENWLLKKFTGRNGRSFRSKNHKNRYPRKIWIEGRGLVEVPYKNQINNEN